MESATINETNYFYSFILFYFSHQRYNETTLREELLCRLEMIPSHIFHKSFRYCLEKKT